MLKKLDQTKMRDALVPLMLLLVGFGAFFSRYTTMVLLYAVLFPLCFAAASRSLPDALKSRERTPKAALISCCILLVLLPLSDMKRVGWETELTLLAPYFVCLLCLLQPSRELDERGVRRATELFGAGMIVLYLPLELLAMFCLYTDRVISLPLADGVIGVMHTGTLWDRLQILSHPNNVGQYAVFILVFCLYFFRKNKKPLLRTGLLLIMLMNVIVLAHVQSRNDSTAIALAVMLYIFLTWREHPAFAASRAKKLLLAALAVAAGVCLYLAIDMIYKLDTSLLSGAAVEDIATRSDTYGKLDVISTGRGTIWKWALGYFRAHPARLLTGIGSDYYNIISAEFPIADNFRSLHCSFLSCLVLGGVPFLASVLYLVITLLRPVATMLTRAERTEYRGLVIVPILICAMFAMSQIESMLYINPHVNPCFQNLMFFALCGYARAFARQHPWRA